MQGDQVERHQPNSEADHLLSEDEGWMEMAELHQAGTGDKDGESQMHQVESRYTDGEPSQMEASRTISRGDGDEVALADNGGYVEYRVYKIRWFGLTQLILLNIVVSWDVSSISPPSTFPTSHQWLTLI